MPEKQTKTEVQTPTPTEIKIKKTNTLKDYLAPRYKLPAELWHKITWLSYQFDKYVCFSPFSDDQTVYGYTLEIMSSVVDTGLWFV